MLTSLPLESFNSKNSNCYYRKSKLTSSCRTMVSKAKAKKGVEKDKNNVDQYGVYISLWVKVGCFSSYGLGGHTDDRTDGHIL